MAVQRYWCQRVWRGTNPATNISFEHKALSGLYEFRRKKVLQTNSVPESLKMDELSRYSVPSEHSNLFSTPKYDIATWYCSNCTEYNNKSHVSRMSEQGWATGTPSGTVKPRPLPMDVKRIMSNTIIRFASLGHILCRILRISQKRLSSRTWVRRCRS